MKTSAFRERVIGRIAETTIAERLDPDFCFFCLPKFIGNIPENPPRELEGFLERLFVKALQFKEKAGDYDLMWNSVFQNLIYSGMYERHKRIAEILEIPKGRSDTRSFLKFHEALASARVVLPADFTESIRYFKEAAEKGLDISSRRGYSFILIPGNRQLGIEGLPHYYTEEYRY